MLNGRAQPKKNDKNYVIRCIARKHVVETEYSTRTNCHGLLDIALEYSFKFSMEAL